MSNTLLSPSESTAFNGFLSSLDLADPLTGWRDIADSVPVPTARGKEALSKATKDLMSLEPNYSPQDPENTLRSSSVSLANTSWPSFPADVEQQRLGSRRGCRGLQKAAIDPLVGPEPTG